MSRVEALLRAMTLESGEQVEVSVDVSNTGHGPPAASRWLQVHDQGRTE